MNQNLFDAIKRYAGEKSSFIPIAMVLSGLSAVCSMFPYLYIYYIIDEVISHIHEGEYPSVISQYAYSALAFACGGIFFYFLSLTFSHLGAFRIEREMRYQAMKRILSFPLVFFNQNTTGKIRKIIDDNVSITHSFVAHQLPDLVAGITMPIVFIVALFVFDWRFGVVTLCLLLLSAFFIKRMMGGEKSNSMRQYMNALEDMNTEAVEYIRGIPVVKTFQQSVFSFKGFHDAILRYRDWAYKYALSCCNPMRGFILSIQGMSIAFVFLFVLLLKLGYSSAALINPFIFYVIFTPLCVVIMNKIMHLGEAASLAREAIDRIGNLLSHPTLQEVATDKEYIPTDFSVTFENVSFSYTDDQSQEKKKQAVINVSFTIPQGKMVALVGASGGGKSTIAKLIPRFADVNSGCIKIGGIDIRNISSKNLMSYITFIFQSSKLFKMSLLDNIRYAKPNATIEEVNKALAIAQCKDIIEKMPDGLNTIIGTKGVYLSGGEQQRISLARAILKDAPIIILDEATAFSDPENEHLFQQAFSAITQDKTVLTIAHRLSTIKDADSIIVVKDSEIKETGTHSDLVAQNGVYASMWAEYQKSISWKI